MERRDFLKGGLAALAAGVVAKVVGAAVAENPKPKKLKIVNKNLPKPKKRKGWQPPVYDWMDTCHTVSVDLFNPVLFTT